MTPETQRTIEVPPILAPEQIEFFVEASLGERVAKRDVDIPRERVM